MTSALLSVQDATALVNEKLGITTTEKALDGLIAAGGLSLVPGKRSRLLLRAEVGALIADTNVPSLPDWPYVRVSVTAREQSNPLTYPDGWVRTAVGVQIGSMQGKAARRAWTGVWPISESDATLAAARELPLLGAIRGWVHRSVARRITGYSLVYPGRREFSTKLLRPEQEARIFAGRSWAWIPVGKGPVAQVQGL